MNAEMHIHQSNRNIRLIELMFFAYRDFTHDADLLLDELGLGRAHHRILHFVWRNPGIHVAELLNLFNLYAGFLPEHIFVPAPISQFNSACGCDLWVKRHRVSLGAINKALVFFF